MKKLLSNSLKCVVILVALVFLVEGIAQAHLYGVLNITEGYSSVLLLVDPQTGVPTLIGNIVEVTTSDGVLNIEEITGVAFNPITGVLYATGVQVEGTTRTKSLLTIDPCTGRVTSQEDISGDIGDTDTIQDISFRSDGVLFAYYLDANQAPVGKLATIDTSGDTDNLGDSDLVNYLGNGMAFSLADVLYLAADPNNATAPAVDLFYLDQNDGEADKVDDLNFYPPIATSQTIGSISTEPGTGTLFGVADGRNLVTIDPSDGDVTYISNLALLGLDAIAFAPPPVADAGADQIVEQCCRAGANVTLNGTGSYNLVDPFGECLPLNFTWTWLLGGSALIGETPTGMFPLGTHKVYLTVDNGQGFDYADVNITVQDTIPPVIYCLNDITVEQTSAAGTPVTLIDPNVFDICDAAPTITNDANTAIFPLGETTVTWTATDASGNSSVCTQKVTVVDTTPPTINSVTATPDTLFPTMCGMLNEVVVTVDADDICDVAPTSKIISVASSQAGSRWFTEPDWFITGADTLLLRAKKNMFSMDNRVYTITVEVTDASGNSSTAVTAVEVGYMLNGFPHSRRDNTRVPRRSRR
jgi:hypothetical protein